MFSTNAYVLYLTLTQCILSIIGLYRIYVAVPSDVRCDHPRVSCRCASNIGLKDMCMICGLMNPYSEHLTTPSEGEGTAGDDLGYTPTPEDLRLREFYGDWVHANPGTHLDGGICNNSAWQAWWHDLAVIPLRHYDAPSGKVGQRFVGTFGAELKGVRDRLWNLEWFIVYQMVILQRARHVTASQAICRRI